MRQIYVDTGSHLVCRIEILRTPGCTSQVSWATLFAFDYDTKYLITNVHVGGATKSCCQAEIPSRFVSERDHVNSIFWPENTSSNNRAASDFRSTRTSTHLLLKAMNAQKYCRTKSHCLVITKSVELILSDS